MQRVALWVVLLLALIGGSFWFTYYVILITPIRIVLPIFLIGLFLSRKSPEFGVRWVRGSFIFLFSWLVYGVFLLVIVPDFTAGLKKSLLTAAGIFYAFSITAVVRDFTDLRRLCYVFVAFCALSAGVGIWEKTTGDHLLLSTFSEVVIRTGVVKKTWWFEYPTGFQFNPNDFGFALCVLTYSCLGTWVVSRARSWQVVATVTACLAGAVTIWTNSRAAMVATIAGALVLLSLGKGLGNRVRMIGVFLVILVIGLIAWSFLPGATGGIYGELEDQIGTLKRSSANRIPLTIAAFRTAFATMGMGAGPGNAAPHMIRNMAGEAVTDPHTLVGEIVSEYGCVFLIAWLVFLWRLSLKMLRTSRSQDREIQAWGLFGLGLIVTTLLGTASPSTSLNEPVFWFAIGYVLAIAKCHALRAEQEAWAEYDEEMIDPELMPQHGAKSVYQ